MSAGNGSRAPLIERPRANMPEPFVSASEAAHFLGVNRRFLLALARKGIAGSYPIGTGDFRKTWIFRLSELSVAIDHRNPRPFPDKPRYDPDQVALAERQNHVLPRG